MKEEFMYRAIELAKKGSGFVNPHPLSAAVIVKENNIISESYYRAYGMESSEIQALNNCKDEMTDAEIYLNIEPFRSEKDNLYFVKSVADSGIKKVYIGMLDANPNRNVDVVSALRDRGVEVEAGVLKERCEELNEIYSYYIVNKVPFVFIKWAMTLDGKLASKTGDSKWISSEESLRFVHELRQRVSAIMVGENTVKLDNPLLTTRLKKVKISNPLRVVLSKYGDLPDDAKVLKVDDNTKTLIFSSMNIPKEKEKKIIDKGVRVVKLQEKDNRIDFREIIKVLGDMKIDSLYIEGGSSVLASALESGVVKKVYAAVAPKIIGGKEAVTPIGGSGIEKMNDAIVLRRVTHEVIGDDVIIKGYI